MVRFVVKPSRLFAGAFLAAVGFSKQVNTQSRPAYLADADMSRTTLASQSYKQQIQAARQRCYLEVYVTDTNEANGPGHVSTSMLREREDGTFEVAAHTSYMPVPLGGLVNAPLLGTVPVPAYNFSPETLRADDVLHANTIIRLPVSNEGLNRGIEKQIEIAKAVGEGRYFYSVTGGLNGLTCALAAVFWAYKVSEDAIKKHEEAEGIRPGVDPNDMLLLWIHNDVLEEAESSDVLNCTSAAEEVIRITTGCDALTGNILPASLGGAVLLQLEDAKEVEVSLLPVEALDQDDEDDVCIEPPQT